MKKQIILILIVLLSAVPLVAQYSPCYKAAFAEGKRLYDAGKYAQAKNYFNEAKSCPDPNIVAVNEWIRKCDMAIDGEKKTLSNEKQQMSSKTSQKSKKQKINDSQNDIIYPTQQKKEIGSNLVQGYGKWGYYGRGGNMVIDYQYDKARDFKEDLAAVELFDRGWGFIDRKGSYVVEPCFNEVGDFYEGRAWARVLLRWSHHCTDTVYEVKTDFDASYNGRYGFINQKGEFAVTPQFEKAENYHKGLATVKMNGKWGYIDKTGEMVINPQFDEAQGFFLDENLARVKLNGLWGYVDMKGNLAIEPQFESIYITYNGLTHVKKNGKWGYLDLKERRIVIAPQFDAVSAGFEEGLAGVMLDGKWGFIDETGKVVIQPQFYQLEGGFHNGVAKVITMDKKWAKINKSGKIIKWL